MSRVFLGTELKLNIGIEPIDRITMDEYDFEIELICGTIKKKSIIIPKGECKRVDANNYIACFSTNDVGTGKLICRVSAYIPDGDFKDGIRTEVTEINTGIEIVKTV